MAREGSYSSSIGQPDTQEDPSLVVLGFTSLASVMMLILGTFHVIGGLSGIVNEEFYRVRPGFDLEMDVTTWGILQVVIGFVLLIGSVGVLFGASWARLIAILFAGGSAIWSFYSIPYYPAWSVLTIVLAAGVIWTLTVHGKDFAEQF